MKEFLRNLFSVDEKRTSSIVLTFYIVLGFALYKYFSLNSFGEEMKVLLMTYISVIGSVNVTSDLVQAFKKNDNGGGM